jgi:hypothetical protein
MKIISKKRITIQRPSLLEAMRKSSPVARAAFVRGNASGVHGGARPKYGKRERQAARREFQALCD